jgi:hypothetical protein
MASRTRKVKDKVEYLYPSEERKNLGLPVFDDDEEFESKKQTPDFFSDKPKSQAEILWTEYGVKPNLPRRVKVEQLLILWRLTVPEIANLLDVLQNDVKKDIETLESEWRRMGQPMTDEEREVAKGRAIGEMLRYKAQLQENTAGNPDGRLMALLLQVETTLMKLQGIDEKKGAKDGEEFTNPVEAAIEGMTDEGRAKLLERMKQSAPV